MFNNLGGKTEMGLCGMAGSWHWAFPSSRWADGRGDAGGFVGKLPVVGIIGLQEWHGYLHSDYRTTAFELSKSHVVLKCHSTKHSTYLLLQDILAPAFIFGIVIDLGLGIESERL
jgi:hypothetical protein